MQSLPSKNFGRAWKKGQIKKPVIVLIGGYAGTGKSTLGAHLAKRLNYTQIIPTGIFRATAQTQTTPEQHPSLFLPTYDLHTLHGPNHKQVWRSYNQQCAPVTPIIKSVIDFMAVEKQHLIIEGNHILPGTNYDQTGCHIIELYMYVKDKQQHRMMLGGPTHNRTITKAQFETGRTIHDIVYAEALKLDKPLFECSETDKAEAYFEQRLSEIMQDEEIGTTWKSSTTRQASDVLYVTTAKY